jgi:NAD(P)-dependent dehydrogenase (short-subunit alcohol dehydrogenase family)
VAMTDEFEGTVIVVTGAAGGIGQAVSSWLAARGARVFDLDRRQPDPTVGEFVAVNVLDPDSIENAVAAVVATGGRIDGLVAPGCRRSRRPPKTCRLRSGSALSRSI